MENFEENEFIEEVVEKKQISREGLIQYENELKICKVDRRAEIAEKLKIAREQGDLSENAEYDSAKEEQAKNEARIAEIENILKNVVVVDKKDLKKGVVGIGSHVVLYDVKCDENLEYDIVGATEAKILEGKVSIESPLGKELLGKKKDDVVEIKIGKNKNTFKIIKVSIK